MSGPGHIAMLGPMGPAQIACLSSWQRSGLRTHFLHTEQQPLPRALWRIADRYDHIGPLGGFDADCAARLGHLLEAAGSSHLSCLADQVTLNLWRYLPLLGAGTVLATAAAEVITAMESKTQQVELAKACGFDVLPTRSFRSDDRESFSILPFPLVLRPDRASVDPSFKAEFVEDVGELGRFLGARGSDAPPVVAQPFVSGPNVVVHGARTGVGEMLPLQGYIGRLKNDGVTVMLEPWPLTEQLAQACRDFAQRARLVGVFHFDLLLDPRTDQVWFLEVNARLGGTTAKVYASGYDEPRALLWALRTFQGAGSRRRWRGAGGQSSGGRALRDSGDRRKGYAGRLSLSQSKCRVLASATRVADFPRRGAAAATALRHYRLPVSVPALASVSVLQDRHRANTRLRACSP